MGSFLYNLFIHLYGLGIRIAALRNTKARKWISGRRNWKENLDSKIRYFREKGRKGLIWIHCSSLGEFEQGRPLLEKLREQHPDAIILLTFFSPSGYEVRKDYIFADFVCYLPLDTPDNARNFIRLVNPSLVFFVKYEYWFNLLAELKRRSVPVFVISALFRPQQHFFKPWGKWFLKQLHNISWFFLQNGESKALLERYGIRNFTVSGDTRFDRVAEIAAKPSVFPVIEEFTQGYPILICGSTWKEDEDKILPMMVNRRIKLKYILAPHEVDEERISSLIAAIRSQKEFPKGEHAVARFTRVNMKNAKKARVLIIDTIGVLAHLYKYSSFAYIGGGFGAGIHNVLEAATFGKPVLFGPNYERFAEAVALVRNRGAVVIQDKESLKKEVRRLLDDPVHRQHMADIAEIFVESNRGATKRILDGIRSFGFMPAEFR